MTKKTANLPPITEDLVASIINTYPLTFPDSVPIEVEVDSEF